MNKNHENEKLENGFSVYVNGPEIPRKTRTGLWPVRSKTPQYGAHHITPFQKNNKNFIDHKPIRRLWKLSFGEQKTDLKVLQSNEKTRFLKNVGSEQERKNKTLESLSSDPECEDIFHQILALQTQQKRLLLDALSNHMKQESILNLPGCLPGYPTKNTTIDMRDTNSKQSYSPKYYPNGRKMSCTPLLSNRGPIFCGKNTANNNFSNDAKTFWKECEISTASSWKCEMDDQTTQETDTSDIFESAEFFQTDLYETKHILQDRNILGLEILSNWGGRSVGIERIEVTTTNGECLDKFRVTVGNKYNQVVSSESVDGNILISDFDPGSPVLLFADLPGNGMPARIDIWNYCAGHEVHFGVRFMKISLNSHIIFNGEIPKRAPNTIPGFHLEPSLSYRM